MDAGKGELATLNTGNGAEDVNDVNRPHWQLSLEFFYANTLSTREEPRELNLALYPIIELYSFLWSAWGIVFSISVK